MEKKNSYRSKQKATSKPKQRLLSKKVSLHKVVFDGGDRQTCSGGNTSRKETFYIELFAEQFHRTYAYNHPLFGYRKESVTGSALMIVFGFIVTCLCGNRPLTDETGVTVCEG